MCDVLSVVFVLVIWMLGIFQPLFLSAVAQVPGLGCVIIVEVFLGKPCLAWKVGCLEIGAGREPSSRLLLYLVSFGTTVINKCVSLGGYSSVLENTNKDPE